MYDVAGYIGQSKIAIAIAVNQPLVIQAELVQQRRVQIVRMDWLFFRTQSELIGSAIALPVRSASTPSQSCRFEQHYRRRRASDPVLPNRNARELLQGLHIENPSPQYFGIERILFWRTLRRSFSRGLNTCHGALR